jgi:hypothetical protein
MENKDKVEAILAWLNKNAERIEPYQKCSENGIISFGAKLVIEPEEFKTFLVGLFENDGKAADKFDARVAKFHEECKKFTNEFGYQLVEDFFAYWSEPNRSRTKMRYEQQPTWEIHRRMLTWKRNNFNKYPSVSICPEKKYTSVDKLFDEQYGRH